MVNAKELETMIKSKERQNFSKVLVQQFQLRILMFYML